MTHTREKSDLHSRAERGRVEGTLPLLPRILGERICEEDSIRMIDCDFQVSSVVRIHGRHP